MVMKCDLVGKAEALGTLVPFLTPALSPPDSDNLANTIKKTAQIENLQQNRHYLIKYPNNESSTD